MVSDGRCFAFTVSRSTGVVRVDGTSHAVPVRPLDRGYYDAEWRRNFVDIDEYASTCNVPVAGLPVTRYVWVSDEHVATCLYDVADDAWCFFEYGKFGVIDFTDQSFHDFFSRTAKAYIARRSSFLRNDFTCEVLGRFLRGRVGRIAADAAAVLLAGQKDLPMI